MFHHAPYREVEKQSGHVVERKGGILESQHPHGDPRLEGRGLECNHVITLPIIVTL